MKGTQVVLVPKVSSNTMTGPGIAPKRTIIRDELWKKAFDHYIRLHKHETNKDDLMDRAVRWANGSWRVHQVRKEDEIERKRRSIKFLEKPPPIPMPNSSGSSRGGGRSGTKQCQAVTLSGRPCRFKATSPCGKYCRKHIVKDDDKSSACSDLNGDFSCIKSALAEIDNGADGD